MMNSVVRSCDSARVAREAGDLLKTIEQSAYETQARKRLFASTEEKTQGERR